MGQSSSGWRMSLISLIIAILSILSICGPSQAQSSPVSGPVNLPDQGGQFYPSQDAGISSPAFLVLLPKGWASLTYLIGKGSIYETVSPEIGKSFDLANSVLGLTILSGPYSDDADPDATRGLRVGLTRSSQVVGAKGKLGLIPATGRDLESTIPLEIKMTETDLAVFLGGALGERLTLAVQLVASEKAKKTTVGSENIADGSIQFNYALWSMGWRDNGHQVGLDFQPRVQIDEEDGSIDQEKSARFSYSKSFSRMNAGVALIWHDYSKVDAELDSKISYEASVEHAVGGSRLGVDLAWQPPYYGTVGAMNVGSIGGGAVALRYTQNFDKLTEVVFHGTYGPSISKTEVEDGIIYDALMGKTTGYGLVLRRMF